MNKYYEVELNGTITAKRVNVSGSSMNERFEEVRNHFTELGYSVGYIREC